MKLKFAGAGLLIVSLGLATGMMAQQQNNGESVYKAKCAMCHGAEGQGKVGPALKGTKLSEDDIEMMLAKGQAGKKPPHSKPLVGLNNKQIEQVAQYVKGLK